MTQRQHFNAAALQDWPLDKRYLVGVSGGRDSVALLDWLVASGYRKLIVCHLDHRLRGRSSAADARFVRRLAEAHSLDFEQATADVRQRSQNEKLSIEAAARAARYSFFATVARRRRCRTIFLGHQGDDLVETFLINLFRGAGAQGQRSIRSVSARTVDGVELTILRPLLASSRASIDEYVRERRLKFREDATNQQLDSLRNRVRHCVIPLLEREFGRDIRLAVRRAAAIAAEEDALLNAMVPQPTATGTLAAKQLRGMPVAVQRRTIAKWLRVHAIADVGFDMVEQVRALLAPGGTPAKVNLTRNRHARRRAGELFIE